jgi:Mn-dependent DtxR family transcriptional regulator
MPKKRGRGNTYGKVDLQLLHEHLWRKSGRQGLMTYRSGELAELLGIAVSTMSITLGKMVEEGRLKKIGSKYYVNDPNGFKFLEE